MFGIGLEDLHDQTFESVKIDFGVRIEKVEVDVDKTLLFAMNARTRYVDN